MGTARSQGVDYSDSYSPTVHDITFCALILAMMVEELSGKLTDVETAFLHGELEEGGFSWSVPMGMDTQSDDEILVLDKCIYGLV